MPAHILIPLCVISIFAPVLTGYVPARGIAKPKVRLIIAPVGWIIGIGMFTAAHVYAHSLHHEWWDMNDGSMIGVTAIGVILAVASAFGTARRSIYSY